MCFPSRRRARPSPVGSVAPRGFALVEVLLAVILINVGLLALVAGSAVLVRQATDLRIRRNALQLGTNRLQLLGAAPCGAASGAANGAAGVREQWSVDVMGNGVRDLRDSVIFSVRGELRSIVLRTRLPC